MKLPPPTVLTEKDELHPRNPHRSRYNFKQLAQTSRELAAFVQVNKFGDESIDFANPTAVEALNRALLRHFYGIGHWDIPPGYLCPPIPGRADYIHYLADLLAADNHTVVPRGAAVRVLDVGVGANCIYPIIGHQEYGWHFVGSDIDAMALRSAQQIVASNPALAGAIECRLQPSRTAIFDGIIRPGELFDLTLCNPPFHASAAEAAAGTRRKATNLGTQRGPKTVLNFGGQQAELWCTGGEEGFVRRMIQESAQRPTSCRWFTTLISKKDSLPGVYQALKKVEAGEVRTISMAQGQKKSRLVAWSFLTPAQQAEWQLARWAKASE
ncbi:23S rRNA (adenine(1618)-N(6))-methyltransferase RlmF [Hymenobacter terrenus]|uniref:23S rRNA (adenine(1618)-N(6))-methyltransferase RlmF n=1 Tax=Hymenobacter terrenus TaxID=1629124 RepID=UPI0006191C03|nr:23S rRNA (adenine(1618)-N(6))-methyltransferase RlmF [Hymenobacter terrenus]